MAAPRRSGALAALLLAAMLTIPAQAGRAQSLIRDAGIEHALRRLSAPLAAAAGLSARQLRVMVIRDSSLNAFVVDSRTIMIHSGLLLKLDSAAQLQAVLSHEMAHIANGHITRRLANLRSANTAAALGMALSAAVMATGNGKAGAGLAMGTASAAQRAFFAHTRAEESSADQAGVRYLARAGIDPNAMVEVLEIFRGQEVLGPSRQDPYVLTHPLSRDRLRALKGFAAVHGAKGDAEAGAQYWFLRARGKLGAFLQNPSFTLRKLGRDDGSEIAVMRRAIAYHRRPDTDAALREIDRLAAMRPADPFVQELRGQILLESRRFDAAVGAYARAVELAPAEPLILAGYGRALLALDTGPANRKALSALERARDRDPFDPRMLRDLAVARARAGQDGLASLAVAERYAVLGRLDDAAIHAERASGLLPRGSAGWLRAQDVLSIARQAAPGR